MNDPLEWYAKQKEKRRVIFWIVLMIVGIANACTLPLLMASMQIVACSVVLGIKLYKLVSI